jgi:hypothetical protein
MSAPEAPTRNGSRLGVIETLANILRSLTLQNVLVMGILVVLAIPSYAVWSIMTDSTLRKEIMSFAKEQDMGVPCQVINYSFSGQSDKTAVISGVQVWGQFEIIVGTKVPGAITATDAASACKSTTDLAGKLRGVLIAEQIQTREKQ